MLDTLEKIAAETGQTKESLEALPSKIITAQQLQLEQQERETIRQLDEIDIDDSVPPPPEPQPQGAIEESEPEKGEEDQSQDATGKGNTPENTLSQSAIAEIRGINNEYN